MRAAAFGAALLALLAIGGALRWAVAEQGLPSRPGGDELYYLGTAVNLAEGRGHLLNAAERAFRPPAWPWLLSLAVDPARRPPDAEAFEDLARLDPARPDPAAEAFLRPLWRVSLLLGALLVPLAALLGRALFDARSGLVAGALAAVSPTLVASSLTLMSEALFAVLVSAGVALAVASRDRRSAALAAGAGLVLGAATLTRELGAPVAAICAVWSLGGPEPRGRAAARAALLCACTALVVAPWTWRNAELFGRLVPVSTVGWFAAAEGNTLEHPDWLRPHGPQRQHFKVEYFSLDDEMERLDFARAHTWARIRAEQPLWLPRKLVRNLGLLWTPDTQWLERIREGDYAGPSRGVGRVLLVGHALFYALLVAAACLGLFAARRGGRAGLGLALLGAVSALHVLANATPRFRVPWLPLLGAYAAHGLLAWRAGTPPPALRRRAGLAALAVLAFLAWASTRYFLDGAAEIWTRPDLVQSILTSPDR